MARVAFIVILLLWLGRPVEAPAAAVQDFALWGAGYALLLLGVRVGAWAIARQETRESFDKWVAKWVWTLLVVRLVVVAWFGCGIYELGWPEMVWRLTRWARGAETPGLIIGTLPAMATWVGIWWAAYPAERAIRERRALVAVEHGWPVMAPPTLGEHLVWNLRSNVLFLLAPVLAIFTLRDATALTLRWAQIDLGTGVEASLMGAIAIMVLLLSPPVLVRVLPTQRLEASPLRIRLEELCARHGLRYRDIRLWNSGGLMANAAMMGLMPQVRYLLISDLVLAAMPEEQVLAVFAHESGHVVKHHLAWLGLTSLAYVMGAEMVARTLLPWLEAKAPLLREVPEGLFALAVGLPAFIAFVGYLSRCFEREADLFAARSMSASEAGQQLAGPSSEGASVVAGALESVAVLNHINPRGWEWMHGSIASRCDYVRSVAADPQRATRFDGFMRRVCAAMILLAAVLAVALAAGG